MQIAMLLASTQIPPMPAAFMHCLFSAVHRCFAPYVSFYCAAGLHIPFSLVFFLVYFCFCHSACKLTAIMLQETEAGMGKKQGDWCLIAQRHIVWQGWCLLFCPVHAGILDNRLAFCKLSCPPPACRLRWTGSWRF